MTFLIVEDSRTTRNLVKNYLNEIKFDQKIFFLEAEDGETALDMIKTRYVDFVLLDWNLSTKMTGLDILKTIRATEKHKNLPVIMITGESDKPNVIEAIKHGANDFASKPIDQKTFAEKILKAVSNMKPL
ncbi:MAG: response regulator [Treponema sp.]|jgi:two-component system chemotaxis response regulator CheY|nr:response regulator [Treponema sp.]